MFLINTFIKAEAIVATYKILKSVAIVPAEQLITKSEATVPAKHSY